MGQKDCNGRVVRDGTEWHCISCGHVSTSWSTKHPPLRSKALHFVESLITIIAAEQQG